MRSIVSMDTTQIELTNLCRNSCSNCTRFAGHRKPYFMSFEFFKRAVDSMEFYPKMTGFQGGEPLLHPDFEAMCNYAHEKIPPERLGLWTTLPEGYERYREVICRTFKHIFINDHSRPDIFHHPVLVGIEEQVKHRDLMWTMIDQCWAQESWSASIYPNGAWFCEIAGSMSMLFQEECKEKGWKGWDVEPGWWWRIPADYGEQMERFCPRCGFPAKLRRRSSQEGIDDVSPLNMERIKPFSKKLAKGKCITYDFEDHSRDMMVNAPLARYKDMDYRSAIAKRYGIHLIINDQRFWTPILLKNWEPGKGGECSPSRTALDILMETRQ